MSINFISLAALAVLMLTGAWLDIWARKLPNLLCLLVLLAGSLSAFSIFGLAGLGGAALHAALALIVGMGLFQAGMIGGGDAKFYAATAIWFPIGMALKLLLYVSSSGLFVLAAWFFLTRTLKKGDERARDKVGVPYGVAIALGAIVLAVLNLPASMMQ